jgi:hypothetical protein
MESHLGLLFIGLLQHPGISWKGGLVGIVNGKKGAWLPAALPAANGEAEVSLRNHQYYYPLGRIAGND